MNSILRMFKKEPNSNLPNVPNISYDKNFIFIHIPKNAGTSIYKNIGLTNSKHIRVREYIELLGQEKYNSMFSFALVRNPFSRFLSLYNYARMDVSYYHNNVEPEKGIYGPHLDYEILKDKTLEEAAILLKEGKLTHNPPHVQWNPQTFWLKDDSDKLNVKYIGRIEDLDLHMRNIYQIIGLKEITVFSKVNRSSEGKLNYKDAINSSTRQILESYYEDDLNTFNYGF